MFNSCFLQTFFGEKLRLLRKHSSSNKMNVDTWWSTSTFWKRGYRVLKCKLL